MTTAEKIAEMTNYDTLHSTNVFEDCMTAVGTQENGAIQWEWTGPFIDRVYDEFRIYVADVAKWATN
jgi:hypothetical protein